MSTAFQLSRDTHAFPEQTAYWTALLAGWEQPTVLPRDFLAHPGEPSHDEVPVPLPAACAARCRALVKDRPALGQVLVTAVVAVLGARATDTEQVQVVTSHRHSPGAPDVAFPLGLSVTRRTTGRELLAAARSAYQEATAHLDVPVTHLMRSEGHLPTDLAAGVDGELSAARAADAGCVIHAEVRLRDAQPHLVLRYRADLFTGDTARRLADACVHLLDAVTRDPDAPMDDLLDAFPAERAAIAGFNATARDFPDDVPLHHFLERQAARTPQAVAIRDDGTTYAELDRRANQLAHRLRAAGVGPGAVVGVCLARSPLTLTTIYAILKAGGAYLPIDPTLPANRIAYMLEHSRTGIVVGDGATRDVLPATQTFLDVSEPGLLDGDAPAPEGGAGPDDLCYVIYTSGSTGRPKGVMLEHRAVVNRLVWMQRAYPLTPDDVVLHKTPFTFDVSVWEIFWWTLAGASVCTLASGAEKDPAALVSRIAEHRATVMHFVPSMLQVFLQYVERDAGALASLRRVFASGEALGTAHAVRFAELLTGPSGTELVNLYGPTEAAVDVTHFPCADLDPRAGVPLGRPIDNIVLRVRTRAGTTAPVGTPGELCIGGAGLARGYLNAPELTAERFVEDPELPGGRGYRTGDLARWLPDGTLEYLGRIDTQVKIRGYRIETTEIEHVAESTPGVAACAVLALDDGGDRSLCAYVVPGPGYDEAAVRERLAAELPAYMVPQFVVALPAIPTTHNGKRDVKAFPPPPRPTTGTSGPAPTSPVAVRLAEIWARVLGVETIGVEDNFFALGGDSIKIVRVLAEAQHSGLDFTFQDLFAHPTLAALEPLVRQGAPRGEVAEEASPLTHEDELLLPPDAVAAYPLSALQAGLLYEVELTGHRPGLYHDVVSYRVGEPLVLDAFRAAADAVAARHPMLRSSLHVSGYSEPLQIVHADAPDLVEVTDLSELDEAAQERELAGFYDRELARGFRPEQGGLVRVRLHLLGERGYQYSLSYHAAALDGWSVTVVHHDLFAAYLALRAGREPEFAPLGSDYERFVRLERSAVASADSREFWQGVLDDHDGVRLPRYPFDPAAPAQAPGVVMHDVPLAAPVPAAVERVAERLNVPVKSVLMAAHVAVLAFVTGSGDVLTGYEHSGRPEVVGGDRIAGLFLNTVPFRVRVADGSWADLVREVYRTETELLPHRRYPMGEMKRVRQVQEPLFEAVFNFTHFHLLDDLRRDHGLRLVRSQVASETEFPFRAEFWQDAFSGEVALSLHYYRDVFPAEQIERIAGYYRRALELLTARPESRVREVTLMGGEELELLTTGLAGPVRELPEGGTLGLFAAQVAARPDGIAVRHRSSTLTYRELDTASAHLADRLHAAGVRAGDVVATPMDRGIGWAVSVLAVLRLGAVYLPQEPADPPARLRAMLARSASRHVLTAARHRNTLAERLTGDGEGPVVLCYEELMAEPSADRAPGAAPAPADPAYLIFTSGSTGEPKGALIHHEGMLNHLLAKVDALGMTAEDVVAQVATQCFDISVWQLLAAWLVGGTTVVLDAELVTDLPGFARALEDERVSVLEVVPSFLDALLGELADRPRALPALRWNLVTGEAFPPALSHGWFERYDVPMVNAYGPTETSDDVTHHVLTGPATGERLPVGRPIANTNIHVVDSDGRPVPFGTYGEILVTGTGVGLGYLNDPERTARAFVPNTLDTLPSVSGRLYRTGDIGRWLPGGILDCAGRRDHQTKLRGFRIELSEVEGALAAVPGVDHAVALVRRDGGRDRLAAWYTGTAEPSPGALSAALARTLPRYMVPDVFERLESFPVTRNGKVDRAALSRRPLTDRHREVIEPPANAAESAMIATFGEILGVPADTVSATAGFFDLGGHSLAAMRLAARLPGVSLRDVVDHPTPRALAALAARTAQGAAAERAGDGSTAGRGVNLLTDLTAIAGLPTSGPLATVVCFPFAGGTAASYLAFTRALHEAGAPVRVLAADFGHALADGADVRDLAAAVADRAEGPLVLLGHSAGAAPAVDTAFALRRRGQEPAHVFVVASLPRSDDPADHDPEESLRRGDEEVWQWLGQYTGLDTAGLPAAALRRIAQDFRRDSAAAAHSWTRLLALPAGSELDCPVSLLLAADDPLTRDHEQHVHRWARLTRELDLSIVGHGGHHLNSTRPDFLAEQVRKAVRP
ncbi:non-ribosomal peptide synthetase [Kitasatospora aureofaciens]|uniref:non-ribosomal peptide synthetase n=1 Tax=Kitasatospora aureofaciens TaxID=1894 RepID=UPI00068B1EFD|nr:non-ribosomal peptide synthetase [Kitasatospora aureofaciens]HJD83540.1 non-ribosomal peptide synthetase [Kitasatospora aureofaciens]